MAEGLVFTEIKEHPDDGESYFAIYPPQPATNVVAINNNETRHYHHHSAYLRMRVAT
jgi:hypothetical protein